MRPTPPDAVASTRSGSQLLAVPLLLALLPFVPGCQDNETAIARGDRLWADSSQAGAVAEYHLAVTQRGDEAALARLAHALAVTGELEEARDRYSELLDLSSAYTDQAVYDFLHLGRRAARRGDAHGAAAALSAALALRPELQLPGVSEETAGFYRDRGDVEEALRYYRLALTGLPADSAAPILYQMGLLEEQRGRCDVATDYFRAFEEAARGVARWRSLVGEADWHTGRCAFQLAQSAREEGRTVDALAHLETMIGLGVPENLLDQAWLDRGDLLFEAGRYDEALAAYRRVVERNPARTGQLVERAQRRIDEIRFGDLPSDTTGS